MRKKSRVISVLLSLLLMIPIVSCSSDQDAKSGNSEAKEKKEKVVLEFWGGTPTDVMWARVYDEMWLAEHPDIEINYTRTETEDYKKKLQPAMAAGEGPDLLGMSPNMLYQYRDFVVDLADLAKRDNGDNWRDKYVPMAIDEYTLNDGAIPALPICGIEAQAYVIYNKTMFDEMGIKETPKTFEEWKAIAEICKENGYVPAAYGGKDAWLNASLFIYISQQFERETVNKAIQGEASWTSPALVETMEAWKELYDSGIFQDGCLGVPVYPDARDQYYYSRQSPMFLTGSWHIGFNLPGGEGEGTLVENDDYGIFKVPQIGPLEPIAVAGAASGIAINKESEHQDEAWMFVNYLSMGDGGRRMGNDLEGMPALVEVTEPKMLVDFRTPTPVEGVKSIIEDLKTAGNKTIIYPELESAISNAMQNVALGSVTSEEALKDVHRISDDIERVE